MAPGIGEKSNCFGNERPYCLDKQTLAINAAVVIMAVCCFLTPPCMFALESAVNLIQQSWETKPEREKEKDDWYLLVRGMF